MSKHSNNQSAKLVFQVGFNALGGAAPVLVYCLSRFMSYQTSMYNQLMLHVRLLSITLDVRHCR